LFISIPAGEAISTSKRIKVTLRGDHYPVLYQAVFVSSVY